MGQAKQRGTREQRVALAVQQKEEAEALRIAQQSAQRRIYDAAYRSGMIKPGLRNEKRSLILASTLAMVAGESAGLLP